MYKEIITLGAGMTAKQLDFTPDWAHSTPQTLNNLYKIIHNLYMAFRKA